MQLDTVHTVVRPQEGLNVPQEAADAVDRLRQQVRDERVEALVNKERERVALEHEEERRLLKSVMLNEVGQECNHAQSDSPCCEPVLAGVVSL